MTLNTFRRDNESMSQLSRSQSKAKTPAPKEKGWEVIRAGRRMDHATIEELEAFFQHVLKKPSPWVAVDLEQTQLVSLPVIKLIVTFAERLEALNGRFYLIAPSEKIKRHFEAFGTLRYISIVRQEDELLSSSEFNQNLSR